jgi:hypothetical protein
MLAAARTPSGRAAARGHGSCGHHTSSARPATMNHSRSGWRKNPMMLTTQIAVVTTRRPRELDRCASHPRTKNQATPWVR